MEMDLFAAKARARRLEQSFDITEAVQELIVVAMPARSGSSWLIDMLKHSRDAIHLRGEVTSILRLHGLATPGRVSSEALDADDALRATEAFRRELSVEAGWPAPQIDQLDRFIDDVLFRLALQWPSSTLNETETRQVTLASLQTLLRTSSFDAASFTQILLTEMAKRSELDLGFYDFGCEPKPYPGDLPWEFMLESPPFIHLAPWQRANANDFKGRPLIIKSAGDIHRLSFYRALFHRARMRVVHLVRNPAATVNGLMDGWLSAKYHSFKVGGLDIAGYSDHGELWRKDWWNFDLPPGWEAKRNVPLVEVCGWQWETSQRTILDWLAANDVDTFMVRYEDLIGGPEERCSVIARLCKWIGLGNSELGEGRIVNASKPPKPFRWKERRDEILATVMAPGSAGVTTELGYQAMPEMWP